MGRVIGHKGSVIKNIVSATGAEINTAQGEGFLVKGSPSQIEDARKKIMETVEEATKVSRGLSEQITFHTFHSLAEWESYTNRLIK